MVGMVPLPDEMSEDAHIVVNSDENERVCWGPLQTRKDTITRMWAFIYPRTCPCDTSSTPRTISTRISNTKFRHICSGLFIREETRSPPCLGHVSVLWILGSSLDYTEICNLNQESEEGSVRRGRGCGHRRRCGQSGRRCGRHGRGC